jgi:helicase
MTLFIGSVGIDRHKDPTIRDLNGAKRDAIAVWALFVDTLPEATSTLLTDDSANLAAVENLLATTLDAAGPEDAVIAPNDERFRRLPFRPGNREAC